MDSYNEHYFDDDIMDDYYGGSDSYADFDASNLRIDTRSLQVNVSGKKSLGRYKRPKDIFEGLHREIRMLGKKSMTRSFAKVAPDILEGYVRDNIQEGFGFNDFHTGLLHAYYARLILNRRQVRLIRISNKISIWGSTRRIRGKSVYRLTRGRHVVSKKYKYDKWHSQTTKDISKSIVPKFDENGKRLKYRGRELNWRGRRLKGKHGGKFEYRAQSKFRPGEYSYESYYKKNGRSNMYQYYKKVRNKHPHEVIQKAQNIYRYINKRTDPLAKGGFKRYVLHNGQFMPRQHNALEIFNAAPYSRRVDRLGYSVLPELSRQRDIYGRKLATLMQKDFDKFFR